MPDPTDPAKDKAKPTPPLPTAPIPNPLIKALLGLPDQPANAVELIGFLGPVDACGNVRLYLNLDLCASYEFPAKNILYAEPPDTTDPTKPTKIMVDNKTNLELVLSLESSFLEGAIAATFKLGELKSIVIPLLKKAPFQYCHEASTKSGDDEPG